MAFNPDAYLAKKQQAPQSCGGFDPDAFLHSKALATEKTPLETVQGFGAAMGKEPKDLYEALGATKQANTNPRAADAMLQGFGEQASFGYLPQLQGMADVLTPNPNKELDEKLKSQGFQLPADPSYVQARDAAITRSESLKEAAPESFLAGQVGGALGGGAGMAGVLGKAGRAVGLVGEAAQPAGLLMRGAQATGAGALQGAIQNPGDVQGQITGLQIPEREQNAKTGAALGAAGFGAASVIGGAANALSKIPAAAKYMANLKALKSAGIKPKDFEQIEKRGNVEKIGQAMMKNGLVEPGSTFEDVAKKSGELREQAGKTIGSIYKEIEGEISDPERLNAITGDKVSRVLETRMDPYKFATEIEKSLKSELRGKSGATQARNAITPILNELKENGADRSILKMQDFKSGIDNMIKYDYDLNKQPLSKQYLYKIRNELKKKIEDHIGALDAALGKDRIAPLREANEAYGTWSLIHGASNNKVARESMNRFASLTDTIAAAGGIGGGAAAGYHQNGWEGAAKGAALGAAAGAVNKASRLYGNPILTKGLNAAGGAASAIPNALPQAVGAGAGFLTQNPIIAGSASAGLLQPPQKVKP